MCVCVCVVRIYVVRLVSMADSRIGRLCILMTASNIRHCIARKHLHQRSALDVPRSLVRVSVLTRIFRPKGTNNICDPALHLECSGSQYQTLVACVPLSTKDSKLSSMFTEFCSQSPDSS